MVKKVYTGKNYVSKKKTFNYVSRNYNRARFDKVYSLLMTSQGMKFDNGEDSVGLFKVLEQSPDFQMYRQLYQSFKVTGVAICVVFGLRGSEAIAGPVAPAISFLTPSDGTNFGNVVEADRSIILGFDAFTHRAYWNLHAGLTGWMSLDNIATDLKQKIAASINANPSSGTAFWSVKVSVWCIFKNKN